MSPKERAKLLVDSFIELNHEHAVSSSEQYGMSYEYHKKCAIKVVDNMILAQRACYTRIANYYEQSDQYNHLVKVKKEIELL